MQHRISAAEFGPNICAAKHVDTQRTGKQANNIEERGTRSKNQASRLARSEHDFCFGIRIKIQKGCDYHENGGHKDGHYGGPGPTTSLQ